MAATSRRIYFSLLHENEIDCIARMLSSDPNDNWAASLDPEALKLLVGLDDKLSGVARRIFKNTLLCPDTEQVRRDRPGFVSIYEPVLTDCQVAILKNYGSFVEKIDVRGFHETVVLQMFAALAKYGSSLKLLNIFCEPQHESQTVVNELLEVRGNLIESLTVMFDDTIEKRSALILACIAEHCRNLEELNLMYVEAKMPPFFW